MSNAPFTTKELEQMLTEDFGDSFIKTSSKDRGWDKAIKQIKLVERNNPIVKSGVLESAGAHKTGKTTVAQIAAWNHFGVQKTKGPGIPARPWMQIAIDKKLIKWERLAEFSVLKIYAGHWDVKKALDVIGTQMTADFKRSLTQLKEPPNADSTIRRKKSSNPLIDSGQLRASHGHAVFLGGKQ